MPFALLSPLWSRFEMKDVPDKLSHYEIVEEIGRGGMGVVYRARDTELRRDVAVKVLPEAFVADKERLTRFEREARVLAALNHPGIATIHELGREGSTHFLVMELVAGDDLAAPLSLDEVLKLFPQIAEALEAAHGQGVVHRDLKPANVRVTPEGRVKLLDFGLAKPVEASAEQDPSLSPTLTREGTATGVILGTASYMSPEQALGKTVDKRADVWAFGCVLYEALSGRKAFPGQTVVETLAAVLRKEPDWDALPSDVPAALRTLVKRCLRVDPDRRLHDIADARIVLEDVTSAPEKTPPRPARRFPWPIAAIALLAAVLTPFLVPSRPPPAPLRLSVLAPEGTEMPTGEWPEVSPDGTRIAFVARDEDGEQRLWVRALDSFESRALPGTEGASLPFWSPGGERIGFFAGRKLATVDVSGGEVRELADVDAARSGAWSEDGIIMFSPAQSAALSRVSDEGGPVRAVTTLELEEFSHRRPQFLPGGRQFLYWCTCTGRYGTYLGTLDSDEPHRLVTPEGPARFVPPGYLVFFSSEEWLVAHRFDAAEVTLLGEPFPLSESPVPGVETGFGVSANGVLAYRRGPSMMNELVLYDREGREIEKLGSPGLYRSPELSPDGSRVAFSWGEEGRPTDIWVRDLKDGVSTRIATGTVAEEPVSMNDPVWSPSGDAILFRGGGAVYRQPLGSSDPAEVILRGRAVATHWAGEFLVFMWHGGTQNRDWDIRALPLEDPRFLPDPDRDETFAVVETDSTDAHGRVSPDGRFIAYTSGRSNSPEVYVSRFPHDTEWTRVSESGGLQPRWRGDGKELYFISLEGVIMAVDIDLGRELEVGRPRRLFPTRVRTDVASVVRNFYDVTPDGQRFVVLDRSDDSAADEIHVIVNWMSLLPES